jgi:hypothetical protein
MCARPDCSIEVIIVINHPENSDEEIRKSSLGAFRQISDWSGSHSCGNLAFLPVLQPDLPAKHAGVGLARKIGMDEAVWRFYKSGNDNGMIVNLDADCTCQDNYLEALYHFKSEHPGFSGCSIYFEHPIQALKQPLRSHIVDYELHLRYHRLALAQAAYPYPFHTVGSSMAVSLAAYIRQSGMNKRKAGEDFYFLHKIFPLGNFYQLNSTTVFPGARYSTKVPFGTGAALTKMNKAMEHDTFRTYNRQSYGELSVLMNNIGHFLTWDRNHIHEFIGRLPGCIGGYLTDIEAVEKIMTIKKGVKTAPAFKKAFFRWFDGLKVLQYLNHASRNCFPDQEIFAAVALLAREISGQHQVLSGKEELLFYLRAWEKSGNG